MPELLLSVIAASSHKTERVLLARFPTASKALSDLMRDGLVEYYSLKPRAVNISAAGRSELRRLRDAGKSRSA